MKLVHILLLCWNVPAVYKKVQHAASEDRGKTIDQS